MNIILTVTVAVLFVAFITLLIKLNPSRESEEETHETEIRVEEQRHLQTSPTIQANQPPAKIEAPRAVEKPLVIVSPTIGGPSVQAKQETPAPTYNESREIHKPEKITASTKTNSSSSKRDCIHHFGYLRSFPKNSPIPDECFGCEKIVDCLVNKKSK